MPQLITEYFTPELVRAALFDKVTIDQESEFRNLVIIFAGNSMPDCINQRSNDAIAKKYNLQDLGLPYH